MLLVVLLCQVADKARIITKKVNIDVVYDTMLQDVPTSKSFMFQNFEIVSCSEY